MLDTTFSRRSVEARAEWTASVDERYDGARFEHVNRSRVTVRPVYDHS